MRTLLASPLLLSGLASLIVMSNGPSAANLSQASCFTASSASQNIAAPSELSAEIVEHATGYWTVVRWIDNSNNETCHVVEKGAPDVPFFAATILPADSECLLDTTQDTNAFQYRVYAADEIERSGYSNVAGEPGPIAQTATPGPFTPVPTPTHIPGCVVYSYPTQTPGPTDPTGPTPFATATPVASWARADLNCDGNVDGADALMVLLDAADLESGIPASC